MQRKSPQPRKLTGILLAGVFTAMLPGMAAAEFPAFSNYTHMVACAGLSSPPPLMTVNGSTLKPDGAVRITDASVVGIDKAETGKGNIDEVCLMAQQVMNYNLRVGLPMPSPDYSTYMPDDAPPQVAVPAPLPNGCYTADNDGDGVFSDTCCSDGDGDVICSAPGDDVVVGGGCLARTDANGVTTYSGDCVETLDDIQIYDRPDCYTLFGRACIEMEIVIPKNIIVPETGGVGYLNPQPEPPGVGAPSLP